MGGCQRKFPTPHSTNSQSFPSGRGWPKTLPNFRSRPSDKMLNFWPLGAKISLHDLHFPQTLGHIDFNPGNILISPARSVFLDWAEACVTNPLVTFEYLLEHMRRCYIHESAATEKITAAYLRPWHSFHSSRNLARGMTVSPLVAVFVCAVAGKAWCSPDTVHNPRRSAYLRSLSRRMYREATKAVEGSEQCVA